MMSFCISLSNQSWDCFAGAEPPGNEEPMIGELKVDGQECTLIADAEGLTIFTEESSCFLPCNFTLAKLVARSLNDDLYGSDLAALGFEGAI